MRAIRSKLTKLFAEGATNERCGLVLKRGKLVEVHNAHPNPDKGFVISAGAMHEHGDKVIGTWHTHPDASAALSQDDYHGFTNWPGLIHYIVGTDGVRAYKADADGIISEC